jgi:hypothetical protein
MPGQKTLLKIGLILVVILIAWIAFSIVGTWFFERYDK